MSEPHEVEAALIAWMARLDVILLAEEMDDLLATVTALVEGATSRLVEVGVLREQAIQALVDAAVGRERVKYAPYMGHLAECALFDNAITDGCYVPKPCDCGLDAIRQAPRP